MGRRDIGRRKIDRNEEEAEIKRGKSVEARDWK